MNTISLAPLTFNATLSKSEIAVGESISVLLDLVNAGTAPIEIASLFNRNNVLRVVLGKPDGTTVSRDPHRVAHEQGVHMHERGTDLVTLAPGKATSTSISLAEWFGTSLEPGVYTITAHYQWGIEYLASTEPAKLTVVENTIHSLTRADDGGRLGGEPRDLLWTASNKQTPKGQVDLYLTRHHHAAITAPISSQFLASIPSAGSPVVSVADVAEGRFVAAAWRKSPGALRFVKLNQVGEAAGAQDVLMPDAAFSMAGSPWCDAEGTLWIFIRNAAGSQAGFITLPPTGTATPPRTWECSVPVPPGVCVRWGRSEALHLVWETQTGGTVYAQSFPLIAGPSAPPQVLARLVPPIRLYHARVDEFFEKETSTFRKIYTLLLHDDVRDMFIRRRVDAAGQTIKEESFLMPGTGFWRVIDSAMLTDDTVAYLFADAKGQVHFGPSDLSKAESLKGQYAQPLTTAAFPCLIPAGGDPRTAKFYVAFVSEGTKIVRRIAGR